MPPHCLQLGIEGVAQRVAQHVEGEHDEEDRRAGKVATCGAIDEELAAVGGHAAELGGRRLRAEAEEGERRAEQDRSGRAAGSCRSGWSSQQFSAR